MLAIAVVIRGSFALGAWLVTKDRTVFHVPDTGSYLAPARDLLAHGTFTRDGRPELARTPGYPLFLVPGVWLGSVEATTIALQIGLSALTVAGVFVLARLVFNDGPVALLAAGLYAVDPLSAIYTTILVSETLFTAVGVCGLVPILPLVRGGRVPTLPGGVAVLSASGSLPPAPAFLS